MSDEIRNVGKWEEIDRNRSFMKCPDSSEMLFTSDQDKKMPFPPLCKEAQGKITELSAVFDDIVLNESYQVLLDVRRSERVYDSKTPITQNQLAFLLWSAQGVQEILGDNYVTLRPVASGGARHAFETYIIVRNVEGLEPGIYHYLPLEHVGEKRVAIELLGNFPSEKGHLSKMLLGQKWAEAAPVAIFLSCVAYRAEWRYSYFAHHVALIDLGHVGQNLMLSASAMGLGSCCIAAYDQTLCDQTLGLDGYEEYTVYSCVVGNPKLKMKSK